jgi:hypothetical protein
MSGAFRPSSPSLLERLQSQLLKRPRSTLDWAESEAKARGMEADAAKFAREEKKRRDTVIKERLARQSKVSMPMPIPTPMPMPMASGAPPSFEEFEEEQESLYRASKRKREDEAQAQVQTQARVEAEQSLGRSEKSAGVVRYSRPSGKGITSRPGTIGFKGLEYTPKPRESRLRPSESKIKVVGGAARRSAAAAGAKGSSITPQQASLLETIRRTSAAVPSAAVAGIFSEITPHQAALLASMRSRPSSPRSGGPATSVRASSPRGRPTSPRSVRASSPRGRPTSPRSVRASSPRGRPSSPRSGATSVRASSPRGRPSSPRSGATSVRASSPRSGGPASMNIADILSQMKR